MQSPPLSTRRTVFAWALYDWGNSAFATAVIAGFFPLFFKDYWSAGIESTLSSFRLGVANSTASLVVLCMAPILGAIADRGALKKVLLAVFAFTGILATACLAGIGQGQWLPAAALFVLGGIGFAAANIFYDALILDVSPPHRLERVSALGYALGYLGGGLFFTVCVVAVLKPELLGLPSAEVAVRASFVAVAAWWFVFTLPLLMAVPERTRSAASSIGAAVRGGFRQLSDTFHRVRSYKTVWLFLVAYWLYIDGVDTVIRMAVDYGRSLGMPASGLISALLVTQFVGFPAALAFGLLGERIGPKRGILIGLGVYAGITLWAYWLDSIVEFYAIAVVIGLVQGGVQALSRAMFAKLIPADAAGEFFGFYNLLGKFAAVLGPAMVGWVALSTGSNRISILSLLVLFGLGAVLLWRVPER